MYAAPKISSSGLISVLAQVSHFAVSRIPAGRVHDREKLGQFRRAAGLFDLEQKLRLTLQIVIARAAIGGGPGQFQGFVVSPKFDREVSFHASARERVAARPEGRRVVGAKFTVGAWRDPSEAAKYASLGLKPAHPAKMLLGNFWM